MTLTIAWVRRVKETSELVIASDSRLRGYGAMDQTQKIFPLQRGDCALAFCGDAGVAYPFFVQAASALNNFIRTRTRADDVHETSVMLGNVLNNLVSSWDASNGDKKTFLKDTRIMFAGWSWRRSIFQIGFFKYIDRKFTYIQATQRLSHPWRERQRSLVVLGDYRPEYMRALAEILAARYPDMNRWLPRIVDFQYEPLEALTLILNDPTTPAERNLIGGVAQAVKVYSHSNVLPIVIRSSSNDHYLFGRKLFPWEKTEYPIADCGSGRTRMFYPMSSIPLPSDVRDREVPDPRATGFRQLIRFLTSRGSNPP